MLEEAPTYSDAEPTGTASAALPKRRRRGIDRMTIGVGVLVALASGGLYYMHARTAAAVAMVSNADAEAATVEAMIAGGREGLTSLTRDVEATRATIERFTRRDVATLAAARTDARDPFTFQSLEADDAAPLETNNASREAAKSRALAAAQRLQLQSIMYGTARRSCLIDGKLYFEGQPLGEFAVSRISPDAVILQTGEFRFELRLRK